MKNIVLALLVLLLAAGPASAAGSLTNARVVQIRVDNDGKGMVIFDQPLVGTPPSCTIPYYANALAFSATGGKSVLALALVAKATNTPLTGVFGMGTCSVYGSVVEDWGYGQ